MRNIRFTLIFILLNLLLIELLAFAYFKVFSNDEKNLELYVNKRISTDQYKYFDEVNLVLPKPNLKIYHYTEEFVDIFETRDILKNGIGFFDDGIDNKNLKAVAIGDSFTRGVGSIDNLKNGWVELVEKVHGNIDIVNLGNLGIGINDQKYGYNQLKGLIDHELVIYNFFAGGDYIDNLNDKVISHYIKKKSQNLSNLELQEMIKDLNKRHGYKHHLEYLKDNNLRSHAFYLFLKIVDYLNLKKIINTWDNSFKYTLPNYEARLNVVNDNLYLYHNFHPKKIRCIDKYCIKENSIFENQNISKDIIKNSSDKINSFFEDTLKDKKKFLLIIHPSARNFYPKNTNIDYNNLNKVLISQLNNKIKIIDLTNDLRIIDNNKPEINLFYRIDGHYTIEGYRIVSKIISKKLTQILN